MKEIISFIIKIAGAILVFVFSLTNPEYFELYPQYKNIILAGIIVCVLSVFLGWISIRVDFFELIENEDKAKAVINNLQTISTLCFVISIIIWILGIGKYYFYAPLPDPLEQCEVHMYGSGSGEILTCAYVEGEVYPEPECFLAEDGSINIYFQIYLSSNIENTVDISNIKINILDYREVSPQRFSVYRISGGDGMIQNHI